MPPVEAAAEAFSWHSGDPESPGVAERTCIGTTGGDALRENLVDRWVSQRKQPFKAASTRLYSSVIAPTRASAFCTEPERAICSNVSQRSARDKAPTLVQHGFNVWLAR